MNVFLTDTFSFERICEITNCANITVGNIALNGDKLVFYYEHPDNDNIVAEDDVLNDIEFVPIIHDRCTANFFHTNVSTYDVVYTKDDIVVLILHDKKTNKYNYCKISF